MCLKWPGREKSRHPPQYEEMFALKLSQWSGMRKNLFQDHDLVYTYFGRLYELTHSLKESSPRLYRRQLRRIARLILWDRAILLAVGSSFDLKYWFAGFVEPILSLLEARYLFDNSKNQTDPAYIKATRDYRERFRSFSQAVRNFPV